METKGWERGWRIRKKKSMWKRRQLLKRVGEVVVVQFRETDSLVQKHLPKGM